METFGGITIDDLLYCPNEEYGSGIKTKLYYSPASFISKIAIPAEPSYEGLLTIVEEGILFKGGGWSKIDILVDENEVKNLLTGALQRKKAKSELNVFVLGFKSKVLGFIEMHKNTPFVFGLQDANGKGWIVGNLRNRAFIDTADSSSAKKYEDNAGAMMKITCNSTIFQYNGSFDNVEIPGGFTKGFSFGFNS